MIINATAVYVLWLREMKRFIRSKSRIVGTTAMPLMFLIFLGLGLGSMPVPGVPEDINYMQFLVPGIVGMSMLFTSMFAGISVLWDREFGFLKEIMVAPVSRLSIVIGRIAGGATTAIIQGMMILFISMLLGFRITSAAPFVMATMFMLLISATFIGLGLIFASRMRDIQGFNMVINFIIFPLFFLSGALFPIGNMPGAVKYLTYADPLTYGIDGMRSAMLGTSAFPVFLDAAVLAGFALAFIALGAYLFEKSESV